MSASIIFPKDFKPALISISPLKVLDSGSKQAYLNYNGSNLMMQVNTLTIPYGMSVFDKTTPVKYSLDLSFKGYETEGGKVKQIYDAFNSLDEYMIDMGVKFSKQWFKSELGRDIIKAFYTPCVRFSKDNDGNVKPYPPTLKIQLKKRDDKFETKIYDDKKRPLEDIPLEDILVKNAIISCLIQCTGVWFAGSKFGVTWKAVQIKTDHLPESIRGCAFRDEDDVSATAPSPIPIPSPVKAASTNNFAALADDDDEVDDDAVLQTQTQTQTQTQSKAVPPTTADDDDDDEADVVEAVPVPKKTTTVSAAKVIKKVIGKK